MDNKDLQKELENEIQLEVEREKLKETLEEIRIQTLGFIEKRKKITENILELRKKNLEELKDDEDKIIEYFDHEAYVREEAFKFIERKLRELTILSSCPYFGKIEFEDEFGSGSFYVGRFGLTKEEEYEPIIVDWRSPISALFYAGKLGEVGYEAPVGKITANVLAKRQFVIKKGHLNGIFDTSSEVKDDILQMVLSKNAGEKLKDIVMTIQQEQDEIIRQPRVGAVVVDGVAGSGKTTIALHRIAYLLYNYRRILQDKVLILGPNSIFMDYISMVLPSLGEVGVNQTTFRDFALDILNLNNKSIMSFKDYMEKVLSNDVEFEKNVLRKTSIEYIKELDEIVNKLDYSFYDINQVKVFDKVVVDIDEMNKMFSVYFKDMPLFRRSKKIKRILFSKIKDERDNLIRQVKKEYEDKIKCLSEEELKIQQNNLEFTKRNRIREIIIEVINSKKRLEWIQNPNVLDIYNEFNEYKQLTNNDLAPLIYLKMKLEGLKYEEEIKHIVIDEAQDYSDIELKVIKEITECNSFTIVGDTNQRITPIEGECALSRIDEVLGDIEVKKFKLEKSYRSTKQIINYANKYIKCNKTVPLVRMGKEVEEKQANNANSLVDKIVEVVVKLKRENYDSIAVICKDLKQTQYLSKLIKKKMHIKVFDREDIIYSSGEVIIPSYFAKGLEFDAAIIIMDDDHNNDVKQNKLKYVMSTRALHELYVYRTSSIK